MSLTIASINSGSNGNCYYISNGSEAVLVDIGLSCKEVELRLKRMQLTVENIKAIFISHEHSDHIKGLVIFSNKYKIPVYITESTRKEARLKLDKKNVFHFTETAPVIIGGLTIAAFSKHHDAADPYSFTVSNSTTTVGVFTDIGTPCDNLIAHFKKCHAAFLEANYDEEMLDKGSYPYILKARIKGGKGHLSNRQALDLFLQHRPAHLSHLLLSHLSKNNNNPQLVQQLFEPHANGVAIHVLSRYNESELFTVGSPAAPVIEKPSQLQFSF
ncbi:MAG: hypothetical protein RLZZ316_650 [Bacteroidota bacterium]